MRYPGGKNVAGCYQKIINQIPPHSLYVEPFAGSAAIARLKRPAAATILLDLDPGAIAGLAGMAGGGSGTAAGNGRSAGADRHGGNGGASSFGLGSSVLGLGEDPSPKTQDLQALPPHTTVLEADALAWLAAHGPDLPPDAVVYCDPPYLPSTLKSRLRYRHGLSAGDHRRLLRILHRLPCRVLVSGYWSELYAELLAGWRAEHWPQITRGGVMQEEWLWCSFPEPTELHDYRYLGDDYRERENLARMKRRWLARLAAMPRLKRLALSAAIAQSDQQSAISDQPSTSPPATSVRTAVPAGNGRSAGAGLHRRKRR